MGRQLFYTDPEYLPVIKKEVGPLIEGKVKEVVSLIVIVPSGGSDPAKVDKIPGSSLVPDTEIVKIHITHSDDQDLSGLQPKETGKGLSTNDYTTVEQIKLAGLSNYVHPSTHPASIITESSTKRFVSDTEKSTWDGKQNALGFTPEPANANIQAHVISVHAPSDAVALSTVKADVDIASAISLKHSNSLDHAAGSDNQDLSNLVVKVTGSSLVPNTEIAKIHTNTLDHSHTNKTTLDAVQESLTTVLKTGYDGAVTHAVSVHAPSNAQKNSDITKAEIEAKLTGEIATHTHAGGGTNIAEFVINVLALTSSPTDSQTIYFGMLPKAPTTTANISKIYVRKTCTLKHAEIYCYSGTAGTAEAWSLYVRKNNTTDTLIATLSVSASERVFSNTALNISLVAGDYIEIKAVNPLWATNPLTTIFGGYLYFE